MELWQLRTLAAIAETLNFTKASEKLHLTQSAVSHQIKALEEELGVALFIRGKNGVILTDAGREKSLTGRVRVAAATQALVYLFAPLFEEFMDAYPTVELLFRTTVSTEQTVEDILNGVADAGFASLAVYSPTLNVVELFDDELVLVVGKKHRLARAETVSAAELSLERWILFERGASIRRATDDFFKKIRAEPETALESNDTYFIKLMIEHGLGVSLMPSWSVREEIAGGKLALLKIKKHELRRSVAMLSLKGAQPSPIRAFIEYVVKQKDKLQSSALDAPPRKSANTSK